MPLPIWPAPMTPIILIFSIRSEVMAPLRIGAGATSRGLALGKLRVELRYDLEQVADNAVIGDLEDRRLFILVDGDDHLRILHPGEMLNGAGDADSDIELGC